MRVPLAETERTETHREEGRVKTEVDRHLSEVSASRGISQHRPLDTRSGLSFSHVAFNSWGVAPTAVPDTK